MHQMSHHTAFCHRLRYRPVPGTTLSPEVDYYNRCKFDRGVPHSYTLPRGTTWHIPQEPHPPIKKYVLPYKCKTIPHLDLICMTWASASPHSLSFSNIYTLHPSHEPTPPPSHPPALQQTAPREDLPCKVVLDHGDGGVGDVALFRREAGVEVCVVPGAQLLDDDG